MKYRIERALEDFFRGLAEVLHYLMFDMDKRIWLAFDLIQMVCLIILAIGVPQLSVLLVIGAFSVGFATMATLATIREQGGFVRNKHKNDEG